MSASRNILELLSPAKNAEFGMAAIDHGADAVYIGGPAFGARYGAGNSIADIGQLADYAHRFNARVFVALNTILRDDELEAARQQAWQLYEAGVDALIVQDMGLLEIDLPPIQLHASTQTDIRHADKARFLQDVGFSQIVLARELSLKQIREVAAATDVALEFFVHGALCVAFSGQCNISHAHTGRSANRGECSQACRLPYTLHDPKGRIVAHEKHLLSMKDNDQSANLLALVEAGISSFKIEGRLKDLSYVKNITAHYRQELDAIIATHPEYRRASSGRSEFFFTPQPEKTFNRGATDYFVNDRKTDIGAFDTPKFAGSTIGTVLALGPQWFDAECGDTLHNGDGLSFYDHGELIGVRANRIEARSGFQRIFPNEMPAGLTVGAELFRNRDQAFERQLEKKSAERKLQVWLQLSETEQGFVLDLTDEDGVHASTALEQPKAAAQNPDKAAETLRENLAKLGSTDFVAVEVSLQLSQPWFLPAAAINGLRRAGIEALVAARQTAFQRLPRATPVEPPVPYPATELSYLANVFNEKARQFYRKHAVQLIDAAYEADQEKGEVSLMITKHCLRYSFNLCPKEVKGIKPEPMTLMQGKDKLTLTFDCKRCEMHVVGKARKHRTIQIHAH